MYRGFLAQRYLLSRPINLLGIFAFMLGVWALIVVVSIFSGFIRVVKLHIRSATADVTAYYLPEDASYAELERIIRADPNVEACAPRLVYSALLHPQARGEAGEAGDTPDHPLVTLIGIDWQQESKVTGLDQWLTAVSDPALRYQPLHARASPPPWILLSERRARKEGTPRGDTITVTTANFTERRTSQSALDLVEQEFELAGAYATQHSGFDEFNAFVDIRVLRQLLKTTPADFVSEIVIRLKDATLSKDTAARLSKTLADRIQPPPWVHNWEHRNEKELRSIEHQRSLLKLVLFVIMVVAAFLVFATLSMMVTEKTRDIGILTAMGGTRFGVMQVFLASGFAIGLIGTVLGVVFGCITAVKLDSIRSVLKDWTGIDLFPIETYNLPRVPYELEPGWILMVSLIALVLGLVVAGLPALRAARHDPLQSLRQE